FAVAEEADGPFTNRSERMLQRREGRGFIQSASLMQGPQRLDRCGRAREGRTKSLHDLRRRAPAKQPRRSMSVPLVRMREEPEQFIGAFAREVHVLLQRRAFAAQPVDAAGRRVELTLIMLAVCDVVLVEIR